MTISRPRRLTGLLALAVAGALTVLLAAGSPGAPAAQRPRTKTCDISSVATTLGPTSVTSLKVTGTSCATGKRVVRAFHTCRLKNGPSGRCVRRVLEFACSETRTGYSPQFTAKVTCTKRRISIVHRYTQTV